jgi:hypothetical protein
MKREMEWFQARNKHLAGILAKLKIEEYADIIDPDKVIVIGEDDPRTLTTHLHITISLNKMDMRKDEPETMLFQ